MNHLEKIELIERYYFQQLSEQELQGFTALMTEDPLFKQEVEEYCYLYEGFDALHLEAFSQQLQSFELKITGQQDFSIEQNTELPLTKPKFTLVWNKKVFSIAAAVILLICSIPLLYITIIKNDIKIDQFAEQSHAISPFTMRTDESLNAQQKALTEALFIYNTKEHKKALNLFKDYESKYEVSNQITLYMGICELHVGKLDEAIENFSTVCQTEKSHLDYVQEAEYMLALAYLKKKDKTTARALLDKVMGQEQHNYKKLAVDLAYELTK